MAFKPIDNKRDQFRKYLEASGVIEVLSKSITKLMEIPEKPESPVEFIRENMGRSQKELNEIEFLKEEVEVYKKQLSDLKLEIAGLELERQELKRVISKEIIVPDAIIAKEEVVSEIQTDKQIEVETKTTEDAEPTPVLANNVVVDIANDVKADASAVVSEATDDAKVEQPAKTDDAKTEDKPSTADATAESNTTATADK